jgi:hypothetical protein
VAVAATMMQRGQCRACRLELDPRADKCWFCSTTIPSAPVEHQVRVAATTAEDDGILFARGVLIGVAMVLVPFLIRLTPLPI